jgi:hypothetical protein
MGYRSSSGVCGLDVDILEEVGSDAVVGPAIEQHVDANAVKFSAQCGHDFHAAFDKVEFAAKVAVIVRAYRHFDPPALPRQFIGRHRLPPDAQINPDSIRSIVIQSSSAQAAIDAINRQIDGLAEWLTGERSYFTRGGMSHTAQPVVLEKWERWARIESGEEPWPGDGKAK